MNQAGYSLLLSLFMLLGISGFWFVGGVGVLKSDYSNQAMELELARQALISYAVNYLDHYGAQGAGVGHLPCPDTDRPDRSVGDTWSLDGPNPPCGNQEIEIGWLPRHVNTASGRYHFHARSRQRLWYAVSGNVVNNPLNRVVNPSTTGSLRIGGLSDIVAVIGVPPLNLDTAMPFAWWENTNVTQGRTTFTVVRVIDIRIQAMQRVSSWLLGKLNVIAEPSSCALNAEFELLYWLSQNVSGAECDALILDLRTEFAFLDGVPYARHWFIRNKWFEFVRFTVDSRCINQNSIVENTVCEFVPQTLTRTDQILTMNLQPVVASEP